MSDLDAILDKLAALERRDGELAAAISDLRDGMEAHQERIGRIQLNLAETTDKLNGLIGFMDDFLRRRFPQ